jgi:hypothetical protein
MRTGYTQLNLFLVPLLNFEGNWVGGRSLAIRIGWTNTPLKRNGLYIFSFDFFFEKSCSGCAGCIRFSNNLFELCTMT